MDGMDEIVGEFLVESYENLDQLDRDLVALEQEPGSRALLGSVFRTIHTIKGTSGFLALHQLESVAHVGENLLAKLRDGVMVMEPGIADALLAMVDTIRALLGNLEQTGTEGDVDVEPTVARIKAILDGGAAPAAAAPAAAAPAAAPEVAATAAPATKPARAPRKRTPAVAAPVAAPDLAPEPEPQPEPAPEATPEATPVTAAKPADGDHRRGAAESSIRVDVDVLDDLMRLTGELVLARNQILRQVALLTDDLDLTRAAQRLNLIAGELQEGVMKTRMQPIDALWAKLPRVVRDLGAQCGRQVRLDMVGRETELDRTLLEAVKDPLTHLVRNAVDHGIEDPDVRAAAGKPREGVLRLAARHESGQVVVEVSDDGKGIDPAVIGASAVRKGVITSDALDRMSPADVLQLIFAPGFSTAAAVTNVSGRGVGMDVVKTNIEAIGGTIEVESTPGEGTTCRLRIPLTLAIIPALTVVCGGEQYAVPQVNLQELVALDVESEPGLVEEVGGAPVYRLRGELLPLVSLAEVLGIAGDDRSEWRGRLTVAVLGSEGRRFGLVVDKVLNTEEIVVKALGNQLKAVGLFSGATILGDGAVALILDVQALARRALRGVSTDRLDAMTDDTAAATRGTGERLLVAGIGGGRQVAIPLDMVTRLERIPASAVEVVGSREVVQYRGEILPIVRLDRYLGAYGDSERTDLEVVVYQGDAGRHSGRSVAIVVESIRDVVDGASAQLSDIDDHGLLGSAVIADRVTEMLDVRAAILTADPAFFSSATAPNHLMEV